MAIVQKHWRGPAVGQAQSNQSYPVYPFISRNVVSLLFIPPLRTRTLTLGTYSFVLTFFALLLHEITENDRPSFWKEVIDREGVSGGYVGVVATATAFVPFWLGLGYLANLKHSLPLLSMFGLGCIALLGSAIFFLDRAPEATSALFTTWPFFVFICMSLLFLGG